MEYTELFLFGMGCLGILVHNLVKMDKLNRKANGQFSLMSYWAIERFSILISVAVVLGSTFISNEIKELEIAGKYLGAGMLGIGFMAQSIVISFRGRAEKFIDKQDSDNP